MYRRMKYGIAAVLSTNCTTCSSSVEEAHSFKIILGEEKKFELKEALAQQISVFVYHHVRPTQHIVH